MLLLTTSATRPSARVDVRYETVTVGETRCSDAPYVSTSGPTAVHERLRAEEDGGRRGAVGDALGSGRTDSTST